uniref:Uncharacterized protein n=1 Tax=uncultured delta proteobacterium TaxID=34034 RepID=H5SLN4_9DELT|nr:hypothetical protein HGMM_F46H12C19 [uncultured delta proteobacterium]
MNLWIGVVAVGTTATDGREPVTVVVTGRNVNTSPRAFFASVHRAGIAIVAPDDKRWRATADHGIAHFGTVAEHSVVAEAVVRDVHASPRGLAPIQCARNAVVANGRIGTHTRAGAAAFGAIADIAVVALGVVAAARGGAAHDQVASGGWFALCVVRGVHTNSGCFVASVERACDSVVALDGGAAATPTFDAQLGTVAKHPVVAVGIGAARGVGRSVLSVSVPRIDAGDVFWNLGFGATTTGQKNNQNQNERRQERRTHGRAPPTSPKKQTMRFVCHKG